MDKQYECDRCGACCNGHLIVEVYGIDVAREPKLATADPNYRRLDSTKPLSHELDENDRCLVIAAGRSCPFLKEDFNCAIYPTRPNVCVAMEAGDDQCQSARKLAGLEPLPPHVP